MMILLSCFIVPLDRTRIMLLCVGVSPCDSIVDYTIRLLIFVPVPNITFCFALQASNEPTAIRFVLHNTRRYPTKQKEATWARQQRR
ncbi:hypothetical protein EDB83DRAFT_2409231 [Lactarius deliciosus]|nr:hypothetical protein EDB83DRAFT_2409231 [Lactarius deliciosus]